MHVPFSCFPYSAAYTREAYGAGIIESLGSVASSLMQSLFKTAIERSFFSGYHAHELTPHIRTARRKEIGEEYAIGNYRTIQSRETGKPVDFMHIKAKSEKRTGNALVFVLNHHYQFLSRRQFEHLLNDGLDVILYNPTELTATAQDSDLRSVLDCITPENPAMKLAIYGYCMGSHVATKVASTYILRGKNDASLIADRAFGDTFEFASKVNRVAKLRFIKRKINEKYNLHADDAIKYHKGPMLAISCPQGQDQLLHRNNQINLTQKLAANHRQGETEYTTIQGDHWTQKDAETWNKIKAFLSKNGILPKEYTKVSEEDFPASEAGCCRKSCLVYKFLQ